MKRLAAGKSRKRFSRPIRSRSCCCEPPVNGRLSAGLSNGALRSPDPASAERRTEIGNRRQAGDQAFREAIQRLRTVSAMQGAEKHITEVEGTFRAFESLRSKVDENLSKPGTERAPEVVDGFLPAITNLIEGVAIRLRLRLETLTVPPSAALSQLVILRHLTAQMAENAGRERAALAGMIGARGKLTAETIRKISGFRGQVDLAWETISPLAERTGAPQKILDAIAIAEKEYYRNYAETRQA